ncbi:MAG: hypothetical protein AVDCRST_MAG93-8517 [uncultured Chloroflexia bacterium]|uniref:HTH tetR-type domain-containing protein n=1 Tax=uncultured Chloroflexia bacterium TaxID=1672391 RepID=A0A6J4N1A4_9CHLR|nr:MAG: hypothetical protein AVDCRST_MAG93-8517 [uncultured Chloroflexia bacterium]
MLDDRPDNETRRRILDVAEQLFSERGYAAVRLRDIATAVGMRHASLYYYAPAGKEQLYVEVMERNFERHRAGLTEAVAGAGDDIRAQLHAVAHWLVSQPPLDFSRMQQADFPAIGEEQAHRLMRVAYDSLRLPIMTALERGVASGQVKVRNVELAAMGLVSLVESVHAIPHAYRTVPLEQVGGELVDMLLDGWLAN